MALASEGRAQGALSVGRTWQHVNAGFQSEGLSGYEVEFAVRLGARPSLLLGYAALGHDASATRGENHLSAFRLGLHLLAARSRYVDLGLAGGLGLFGDHQDSEDDGAGFLGFVQAQVSVHPIPELAVYATGLLQGLGAIGTGNGGTALGFNLGIQLRTDGW